MFNVDDSHLIEIRQIAADQLLDGTFPSFCGNVVYDDFIKSVIDKESEIIIGVANLVNLEEVHDYKMDSTEFLVELFEILDPSFTTVINIIQGFVQSHGDPKEYSTESSRIRRARHLYRVLQTPLVRSPMRQEQYKYLLSELKTIGKL